MKPRVIGPQGSGKTLDLLTPALLAAPGAPKHGRNRQRFDLTLAGGALAAEAEATSSA